MLATASFDLFDTLLVRPVADPHDLFRLVERDLSAPGWTAARVAAERAARFAKPTHEVDLDEIYAAPPLDPWRQDLDRFREKELEWESATRLDPVAVARVEAARAAGARILYVTDMYLPRDFLLARLAPVWRAGDTLLISHEAGDSKGRTWWARLSGQYPKPWRHLGDNLRSDVINPAAHGIETEHWTRAHPNRLELAYTAENPGAPFAGGLPRLARLSRPPASSAFWDDGATISGPVLHAYVHWLMQDARARGVSHVYFLSRDGQLPEKMARLLRVADPSLPPCSYLCGSRYAWYRAVFDPAVPDHRRWLNYIQRPTLECLLHTLDIDPRELEPGLRALGHDSEILAEALPPAARETILEQLSKTSEGRAVFDHHRNLRLEPTLAYLRQEISADSRRVALVDIGWSGTMHQSFVELLARAFPSPPRVTGYFFGMHRNATADRIPFHMRPSLWPGYISVFPSVVEMLAPADHGQTVGYEKSPSGDTAPLLAADVVASPDDIAALHGGALAYLESALRFGAPPPRFDRALRAFLITPDSDTITRWRTFRFWTWAKPAADSTPSLIPSFSRKQLLRRLASPWHKGGLWPWPTASVRASCPATPDFFLRLLALKLQIDALVWRLLMKARQSVAKRPRP
jgi:hypothetical protein